MRRIITAAFLALVSWAAWPATCPGQGGPGTYVPYDGAPYSHRYHYGTGSFFYPSTNPRDFAYQDYLDRLDRAQRFGYRIPQDPLAPGGAYYGRPVRFGVGLGFFRWR